jgi:CPA2 family monovalent cation:H+ antiporter-2
MLEEAGLPYLAIEQDAEIVAKERASGKSIYYGDASRTDFLRRCGIAHARAVAVTVNSPSKATAIVQAAKREAPGVHVIARARDERHAMQLYGEGVTEAVPETTEAALQLGEAVLVESGIAMGLAIANVHERRDQLRKRLGRPNRRADLRLRRARQVRQASQADETG